MIRQPALNFVNAINAHDVEGIIALMTEDHVFIDAYGHRESKEEMKQGWPGYFAWFPDYRIEIDEVVVSGDTVILLGYAAASFRGLSAPGNKNRWRIPAAWRVTVENHLVKVWQVYADTKIPWDSMGEAGKTP